MANFPTSLDSLTNPAAGNTLDNPDHADQHTFVNDIAEALEAKVGIGASTPVSDAVLVGTGTGSSGWSTTLAGLTLTSPVINTSLDMNGWILLLDADGDTSILADTDDQIDISLDGNFDFRFTPNTFIAHAGSTIKTNTINETTAGAGVSVEGVQFEDGLISVDVQATTPTTPSATEAVLYVANGSVDTDNQPILLTDNGVKNYFQFNDSIYQQALINGGFDVWQRNTTFTTPNDDTYGPDRWNFLVETNGAWTFTRDTDVPAASGFKYSLKATNVTLNNQCGIVQILENVDSMKFDDKVVTLSFYAKTSGTEIGALRATVLSWSSTADSVTSDVIGTWASDGTDPTFATNWTKEIAGSNLALTSSWQRFTIPNITIDTASMANIAVVIWVNDGTIAANDDFWITGVQLNQGDIAANWNPKSFAEELRACQRYYEKTYDTSVAPGTNTGAGLAIFRGSAADQSDKVIVRYQVTKRTTPTLTLYGETGTSGKVQIAGAGAEKTAAAYTGGTSESSITPTENLAAGAVYVFHWTADAEL